MQKVHDLIILAVIYSLLMVVSIAVPLWITVPAGFGITALFVVRKKSDRRKKVETIQKRLSNLRSEGLFVERTFRGTEDDVFYRMILTLLTDLERSLFKLVEKNIQLLSLKEIGRTIISSLDEKKLIESVFEYLIRGVGYKEAAFILLRKKKLNFQAIIWIEKATRVIRRTVSFGFENLDGAILESFLSGKPFLIKDASMHPLIEVGGEPLFPGSTMTSYLCVPLMKSTEEIKCLNSEECTLRRLTKGEHDKFEPQFLKNAECIKCPGIPLLGALIVTDGYQAAQLTNIDQVTIETVGSLVSSNIENWMLYQDLRKEEIFREKVLESMINGVFVVDLEGGITLANRSARLMSKYNLEDVLGRGITDIIIDESAENGNSPIFRVLQDGSFLTFYEAYLKRNDELHIPIRMNVSPFLGEDRNIQGAIIEFVDLSDIKRMEEEIRHLDRLAVLGRFTSAVAHEIRNPLTGIAAGIQYLNRDKFLSDDQRENISFILNEVDRLNRIITDLFKVAKPRKLLYQKTDLNDLVKRSFQSLSEIFKNKRIDFRQEIEDNLVKVEVDPDQIVQVMINLIKNSAEAVEEGGTIVVRGRLYTGGDSEIVVEKDKDMICIEISDTGPGIDADERERIFEPFYTKKKGGTGLGLFVTHSIVQHHQGKIHVLSDPGDGATFKVYLPIRQPRKGEKVESGDSPG
jgi:PAS domain S-box-containing protein